MLPRRISQEPRMPAVRRDPLGMFEDMLSLFDVDESEPLRMDVAETPDHYEIIANVPGISRDQIDLSMEGRDLTITVRQEAHAEQKERSFIRRERSFGTMSRTVRLPLAARSDEAQPEAKCENGVLMISVPKSGESKSKRIEIH